MAKYYFSAALISVILVTGCASFFNKKGSTATSTEGEAVYRFISQGSFSEIQKGAKGIQFYYVGMDLSERRESSSSVGGFLQQQLEHNLEISFGMRLKQQVVL